MAHFALLDENNIVTRVDMVEDYHCSDIHGRVIEEIGVEFLKTVYGEESNWKQTSYTGRIRKNYAGIGFVYDPSIDAFVPPKPFDSWILDPHTAVWCPPIPKPDAEKWYDWDDENQSWVDRGILFDEEAKLYFDSLE